MEWDCKKGGRVNYDAEGLLIDEEIECQFFEKDNDYAHNGGEDDD